MDVRSDRTYRFPVGVEDVWDAIGRVDRYRSWWPWLRRFEATGLEVGDCWRCTVAPPVPYSLRFVIELTEIDRHERIRAVVTGDITGEAEVRLDATDDGCEVALRSVLAPRRGSLRAVTRFTPWLARFGHDWVLDTGLGQFHRRALPTAE
ncbi:MAG: hypothetical protein U5K30_17080 [Acidimicrobiales bacterium]|nr:hypothetical protein [Acidimicrobiales bacterium]